MANVFRDPPRLPLIAPSILSADFGRMAEECAGVLSSRAGGRAGDEGGDLLHLDVMDGHFVPNVTMGPDLCRWLRRAFANVTLDVHLMVTDPEQYISPFRDAGADHLSFHIEPADAGYRASSGAGGGPAGRGYDVRAVAAKVRDRGMTAGLALNPPTAVSAVAPYIADFELILVMSVNPGYSGQSFIPGALDKAREIRAGLRVDQRLEMDGGVNSENAPQVREHGTDVLVAASAVFGAPPSKRSGVITLLRGSEWGGGR